MSQLPVQRAGGGVRRSGMGHSSPQKYITFLARQNCEHGCTKLETPVPTRSLNLSNFWPWLELGWVTVRLKWMLYVINTVLYMLTSPTKTHLIVKSQNTVKEYDIKVF